MFKSLGPPCSRVSDTLLWTMMFLSARGYGEQVLRLKVAMAVVLAVYARGNIAALEG